MENETIETCPKCNTKLSLTPMSMCVVKSYQKHNWCPKCFHMYSDEELQNIHDAKMIQEDTEIWKQSQHFK